MNRKWIGNGPSPASPSRPARPEAGFPVSGRRLWDAPSLIMASYKNDYLGVRPSRGFLTAFQPQPVSSAGGKILGFEPAALVRYIPTKSLLSE